MTTNSYASRCRSRSSRSSRFVNIDSDPSAVRGHSSFGRSQYSSTPFSSGSRRYSASLTPWSLAPSSGMPACDHAVQRVGQRRPGRIEDRGVKQPGGARRRRMAAFALPGVEADVVVIAAGRDERRAGAHPLHQLEAEHAAIEAERAIEIGDLEMDMPDPGAGDDGWIVGHVFSPLLVLTSPRLRGEVGFYAKRKIRVRGTGLSARS